MFVENQLSHYLLLLFCYHRRSCERTLIVLYSLRRISIYVWSLRGNVRWVMSFSSVYLLHCVRFSCQRKTNNCITSWTINYCDILDVAYVDETSLQRQTHHGVSIPKENGIVLICNLKEFKSQDLRMMNKLYECFASTLNVGKIKNEQVYRFLILYVLSKKLIIRNYK